MSQSVEPILLALGALQGSLFLSRFILWFVVGSDAMAAVPTVQQPDDISFQSNREL